MMKNSNFMGCTVLLNGLCTMSKRMFGADDYSRWTILGQNDGLEGKALQIEKRGQACTKHHVAIGP